MVSRETSRRGGAVAQTRAQAVQVLNRAAQTRQRAEALFQRNERLRRMAAPTATAVDTGTPPFDPGGQT